MKLHQKIIATNINGFLSKNNLIDFGVYKGLPTNTNTLYWDNPKGFLSPRRWKRKAWFFVGAYSPNIIVGFAIVDAGYIGKAFCYVYFPKTGQFLDEGKDKPFAFANDFEANFDSPWQLGNYEIKTIGKQLIFTYKGSKFNLQLDCQQSHDGLSFICPSKGSNRPFHFTYKNLLLPTAIVLEQKGKKQFFDNIFAAIDYSKGYPPKRTYWNWASFVGQTKKGLAVGINLVHLFNDDMENIVLFDKQYFLLGAVEFIYQTVPRLSEWKVRSLDGSLELVLQPKGLREENINIKILQSKFVQFFGKITGKIKIKEQWHSLEGFGVMEEHKAVW